MFQTLINLLLNFAAAGTEEGTPFSPCTPPICSETFKETIRITIGFNNGSPEVYVTNISYDTIMVKPSFLMADGKKKKSIKNISWNPVDVDKKYTKLGGRVEDLLLVTLSREDGTINTPYPIIDYDFILGDPGATHDPSVLYKIPFGLGKKFKVSQGFNGSFSHSIKTRKHAIDIEMPIGTTVCACRAGKVVDVVEKFADDTGKEAETNYIRILHNDGTYGIYAHLMKNGSHVQIGDDVNEGGIIGKSGNSGKTDGPHLHFAVARSDGHVLATISWKFKNSAGVQISWTVGQDLMHN